MSTRFKCVKNADGVRIKVSSVSKLVLVLNFSPEFSLFAKLCEDVCIRLKCTEQVPLTSRASYREHFEVFTEVQLLGGGGLPLEPGPLEKSSRGRLSDCVYEKPDYEWFH